MDNDRILAKGCYISNDTWKTGLNNNDLIIGPSGAGKTQGYVKPNILQCCSSMIVADTKGNLINEIGPFLCGNGYKVLHINFKDLSHSYGYNPLDYIRFDHERGRYNEQDILTIVHIVVPSNPRERDPFWTHAAQMYLASMIAYVMECLPEDEHTLQYVNDLYREIPTGNYKKLINELKNHDPDSFAVKMFDFFRETNRSEVTQASILVVLGEKLSTLGFDGATRLYKAKERINFAEIGEKKTAVFLSISDTDRSMDKLVSMFYTQAMHILCDKADSNYTDHRLPIPVRFFLDDFATNAVIQDFHNLTSVIRSREISVSIILQSITQLNSIYGNDNAATIINNCDNCLYLGGQDVTTAKLMSEKANKSMNSILNMSLKDAFLFTRGQPPRKVEKYDVHCHPSYDLLYNEDFKDTYDFQ